MPKVLVVAVAGVAITGLGITGWRALTAPPPAIVRATPIATPVRQIAMASVLTAYRDIAPGSFLRPGDLSSMSVPAASAPATAWRDTAANRTALIGALVRRSIPHDSILEPSSILLVGDHGFLATILDPGTRAFTIPHEQIISGADLIWPGDHIDLILTQQMPATVQVGHQVSAETVLTDLRVLAVDHDLVQPTQPDGRDASRATAGVGTVTVEVSAADAEKLAVALRLGRVAFALRAASGASANNIVVSSSSDNAAPETTWADSVMHSLDKVPPPPPPSVSLHVFDGAGEQEYKF